MKGKLVICSVKDAIKRMKREDKLGESRTNLKKHLYLSYRRNPYNSTVRNKIIQK